MSSLFTSIIAGAIPAHLVWSDDTCVAFLTIEPLQPGHTLVVPRTETDQWVDLEPDVAAHLFDVARLIGHAQREEFDAARIGLLVQGYAVPHTHVHVWPSRSVEDFDPTRTKSDVPDADLADAAARLRGRLRSRGHRTVPADGPAT